MDFSKILGKYSQNLNLIKHGVLVCYMIAVYFTPLYNVFDLNNFHIN